MNTDYILKQIRPYVVESQMTYADFERAFGFIDKRDQYVVIRIIEDELKIFLVDELVTDDETAGDETDETVLKQKSEIRASNRILIELVQRGDEQAKQDLFVKNSGLVYKFAQRYLNRFPCSLALEDLVQEGYLGMLKAAEKFNFDRHTQFSTYATLWIVQKIRRAIAEMGQTIHLPVYLVEKILKATRLDRDFQMQGFTPRRRIELIAEAMETTAEKITELFAARNAYMNITSLDIPVSEDGDALLGDFIADEDAQSPAEVVSFMLLKEQLDEVLDTLTSREKSVLILRFGLRDGKQRTLEEVGKKFNVTRERIRQIEAKALRKLRHPARSKKLQDFLD